MFLEPLMRNFKTTKIKYNRHVELHRMNQKFLQILQKIVAKLVIYFFLFLNLG